MGTLGRARSATEFVFLFQGSKRTRKRQTSNMRLKWRQELNEVGYLGHSLYHLLFSLLLKIWMPREAASGGDKLWTISCRKEPEKGVISSRGEGREYVEGRGGGKPSLRRPMILLHSVTTLEICLTAPLLWVLKCFEKVTKYWCALKHQELRTLLHQASPTFVFLLWGT